MTQRIALAALVLTASTAASRLDARSPQAAPTGAAAVLQAADIDGDGVPELLALDADGRLSVHRALGAGRFEETTAQTGLERLDGATCALLADLDGDGDLDLFAGSAESRVWLNSGRGSFLPAGGGLAHDAVDEGAETIDLDGDGQLDLLVSTELGQMLYRNLGGAQFEPVELPGAELGKRLPSRGPGADSADKDPDSDPSLSPSARRLRRWRRQRAANARNASNSGLTSGPTIGGANPLNPAGLVTPPSTICAGTLVDQATSQCIEASSTPTLGELYPLSTRLNVSASGRVGMGTTTPSAGLHIISNDGLLLEATFGVGTIPASGPGARLMWYPAKAAFRVGQVEGTEWDDVNVGEYSVAAGFDSIASSMGSIAFGMYARATDLGCVAIGTNSWALNPSGLALGAGATAAGARSIAVGVSTYADADNSGAIGFNASTDYVAVGAHALGNYAKASGKLSTAIGTAVRAESYGCTVVGMHNALDGGDPLVWVTDDPIFVVGNGANVSSRSNALTILKDGKIGAGTIAPESHLHIADGSAGAAPPSSGAQAVFERDADNYVQILTPAADESGLIFGNSTDAAAGGVYYNAAVANGLDFRCNGDSTKLVLDQNGRVGIGTTTPAVRMHVADGTAGAVAPSPSASAVFERSDDNYLQLLAPNASESGVLFGNPLDSASGGIYYNANVANGLTFRCDGDETKMVLDQNGRMGLGTTSPRARLHVFHGSSGAASTNPNAHAVLESFSHNYVQILTPDANESGLIFGNAGNDAAGGIYYNSTVANGLSFRCNGNNTKAVIDQNGRLGVGTSAPAVLLHLAQAGGPQLRLQDLDAGGPAYHFGIAGSDDSFRIAETGVADRVVIERTSGNVGIGTSSPGFLLHVNGTAGKPGGGSWSVASDARLKTNVAELDGALAKLLELRGVTYEYKDPAAIHEHEGEQTGFLAQEVERVFPEWVETGADGYKRLSIRGFEALTVEALRELRSEADERAERDAQRLAALIVHASESEARVAALEARAAESQAQIAALQALVTRALESGALTNVDGR